MSTPTFPAWLDGEIVSHEVIDASLRTRPACYTTTRVVRGRAARVERHARRLLRDAARVGLPVPDAAVVERGLADLARTAFPAADGVVRISLYATRAGNDDGALHLLAEARELGPEPASWSAAIAPMRHPGPESRRGAKLHEVACYEAARAWGIERGVEEAILVDTQGYVVEGARTNLLVVDAEARWLLPELRAGAVEGLAQELLREARPECRFAPIREADLFVARELFALNAVRGAVPIITLDGKPVGSGEPGRNARALEACFAVR